MSNDDSSPQGEEQAKTTEARSGTDDVATQPPRRAGDDVTSPPGPRNFAVVSGGSQFGIKDLSAFRLSQDYVATGGVKVLNQVPVRKPTKMTFFRTLPTDWFDTRVLELKEDNETYLVVPELWEDLYAELVAVTLILCTTRQGVPFLWPVRLPDDMGRLNPWHASAREAATLATSTWIRISANQQLGGYDVYQAARNDIPPQWPSEPFPQIVDIAFRGKVIDRLDHPVVRRLRGEI
jgi:hypothetical protein